MSGVSNIAYRAYEAIDRAVAHIAIRFPKTVVICVLASAAFALLTLSFSSIALCAIECYLLYPHTENMYAANMAYDLAGVSEWSCSTEKELIAKGVETADQIYSTWAKITDAFDSVYNLVPSTVTRFASTVAKIIPFL